ncbi:MAG: hypothetical protein AAGI71_14560 [Bacteroidota bacterium]
MTSRFSPWRLCALFVLAILVLPGCDSDSNGEDGEDGDNPTDAQLLIDTWVLEEILADGLNVTGFLLGADFSSVEMTFNADDTFSLVATPVEGEATQVTGSYTVDEATTTIMITPVELPDAGTVSLVYTVSVDTSEVSLVTNDGANLIGLFGIQDLPIEPDEVELIVRRRT